MQNPTVSSLFFFKKINRKSNFKKINTEYLKYKEIARMIVSRKLEKYNAIYSLQKIETFFKYNRVAIRDQSSRWGSCSSKGNLNFNYRLALLTERQSDYIIVHELCHLKEMNHSSKFWDLVEQSIPDYKAIRTELKKVNMRKL